MKYSQLLPAILILLIAFSLSCEKEPSSSGHSNPLDPDNPNTEGNPYNLQAEIAGGGILLTWDEVDNPALIGIQIYRSINEEPFSLLIELTQNFMEVRRAEDTAVNGNQYAYYLIGLIESGKADTSNIATITINTDPILVIEGGTVESTPTRNVSLTILAFGAGTMIISNESYFSDAAWEDYVNLKTWQLNTGSETKTVFLQIAYDNGDTSDVISDSIEPLMPSELAIEIEGGDTSNTYVVTLNIQAQYANSMKISNSEAFSNAVWIPFSETYENWDLYSSGNGLTGNNGDVPNIRSDVRKLRESTKTKIVAGRYSNVSSESNSHTTGRKSRLIDTDPLSNYGLDESISEVFVQFKNDFEVPSEVVSDDIILDIIPSVLINSDNPFTTSRFVTISLSMPEPHEMAIDTNLQNLESDPDWQQFAALIEGFELPTGAGIKNVYARFRFSNDETTDIVSDDIEAKMVEHAGIIIISPTDDDTVTSVTVDVALFADYADSVKISNLSNLSDANWIAMTDTIFDWELSGDNGLNIYGNEGLGRLKRKVFYPFEELDEIEFSVYAQFKNSFEVPSEVVWDDIIADLGISISINDGDETTPSRFVILNLTGEGVDEVALDTSSENIQSDPTWQPFSTTIENFELSGIPGIHKVYAKFKFSNGDESIVIHDDIEAASFQTAISILPEGVFYTNQTTVTIGLPNANILEMKISDNPDSSLTEWIEHEEFINWDIDDEDGWTTIYAWFRNDFYTEGSASDSVGLDTQVEVDTFYWTATREGMLQSGDEVTIILELQNDFFGSEIGGFAEVQIGEWDEFTLEDQNDGSYQYSFTIEENDDWVMNAPVTASFRDKANNAIQQIESDKGFSIEPEAGQEWEFQLGDTEEMVEMVWIPPGNFTMGSGDARPRHVVTLSYGFWMGKYEVTQSEWQAVLGYNPSIFRGGIRPVESVSWNDVQEFTNALNMNLPSSIWRLPSESEWEYACRAGSETQFHWGDDLEYENVEDYAWYTDNSDGATHDVGQLDPNLWGLYDIQGNVKEFCFDWMHDNYEDAPSDGRAWLVPPGTQRVARGGSFGDGWGGCRSGARFSYHPLSHTYQLGLRLVRSADAY
ncbi:MAG: formylglycine-generating enzyme family protein [Candidatus Electryonea clarkiae]|nr:formylglycine-generating enzyme family protein [Candidatus Electryonea clarkiae]MDP8289279.1 formylglycine-generating enzyme family protein [Candidatus Electryonea clarkiae]